MASALDDVLGFITLLEPNKTAVRDWIIAMIELTRSSGEGMTSVISVGSSGEGFKKMVQYCPVKLDALILKHSSKRPSA